MGGCMGMPPPPESEFEDGGAAVGVVECAAGGVEDCAEVGCVVDAEAHHVGVLADVAVAPGGVD